MMDTDGARSPRGRSRSRSPAPRGRKRETENPEPSNVLGVFGLSKRTTEDDLRREFGKYGPLQKVVVVMDRRMNESRGFGFVTFEAVDGATAARDATNDMDLDGRRIRVDYSVTAKPHDPTPGFYAGRPTRPRERRGYGSRYSRRSRSRSPVYRRRRSRSSHRRRSRSRSPYYSRGSAGAASGRRRSYSRSRSR